MFVCQIGALEHVGVIGANDKIKFIELFFHGEIASESFWMCDTEKKWCKILRIVVQNNTDILCTTQSLQCYADTPGLFDNKVYKLWHVNVAAARKHIKTKFMPINKAIVWLKRNHKASKKIS